MNIAFIDAQNLHLGTRGQGWAVDHKKFRIYLRDKYDVKEAYMFFGYVNEDHQDLYSSLQKNGFIVKFREHRRSHVSKKKGNVDTDIVFEMMKILYKNQKEEKGLDKMALVSGDGDYKKTVDYLIKEKKFKKVLFPNKQFSSSLYKKLGSEYYDALDNPAIKQKIKLVTQKKERGS